MIGGMGSNTSKQSRTLDKVSFFPTIKVLQMTQLMNNFYAALQLPQLIFFLFLHKTYVVVIIRSASLRHF